MSITTLLKAPSIAIAVGGGFGIASGLKGGILHGFDPAGRTSPGKLTSDEIGSAVGITTAAAFLGGLGGHFVSHAAPKTFGTAVVAAAFTGAFLVADAYTS